MLIVLLCRVVSRCGVAGVELKTVAVVELKTVVDLNAKCCVAEGPRCDACYKQHQQVVWLYPPGQTCETV
jgi:hypothetical protein